jgi:triosephosphate isomerase (TIM)
MKKKQRLIIANWKCNPHTSKEAIKLFDTIAKTAKLTKDVTTVFCPPALFLPYIVGRTKSARIAFGIQDASIVGGAQTGLVSLEQAKSEKATCIIVGHSEMRARGESEDAIQSKLTTALSLDMHPVLCIGESERDADGRFFEVIVGQLESALRGVKKELIPHVIIAYEPVWAIGTEAKRQATPHEIEEVALVIRKYISQTYGRDIEKVICVLYGGSVDATTCTDMLAIPHITGLLVGRVSLDPKQFATLITTAQSL